MSVKHAVFIIAGTASLIMSVACGDGGEGSPPVRSKELSEPKDWYVGGTLHNKTVKDWRSARYENRLATSADFVMILGKFSSLPTDLKQRAVGLEACISKAIEGSGIDNKAVSEIGATCAVLLGY